MSLEWFSEALKGGPFPEGMGETVSRMTLDTAPKDGSRVLIFTTDEGWEIGRWNRFRECWLDGSCYEIFGSHWCPLPPNP